ncbi:MULTISPECIES: transposase [unclassified Planococcus (in: firmicutes)]|uniref:transposase n=1 Tax=unclassified Planococcus (in: firmicutes) TaxID=2662419 RepID=UPI000C34F5D8|nr:MULTISPECIES: transposase [unclassified Planococcus (in: firmicutes)]AUD12400.1 hypothetical protein CW734_00555 [Planococcus sp. MB-3u-03]PKG46514.1 hypothetical protein CXF66_06465 [Planococcus sp. Urea-trap-24]
MIGLDDWALKRGMRYGTIICDLEQKRPIELLESRKEKVVSNWLKKHPSISSFVKEWLDGIRKSPFDRSAEGDPSNRQVALVS